jgi:tRNA (guanine10-N2)-dimethyltransferase
MYYLFYLSGANRTLPKAEVTAVFEALGIAHRVVHSYDQILVVEAEDIRGVPSRLALCHGVYEFLGVCRPSIAEIARLAERVAPLIKPPVAVRVRRIRGKWRELRTDVLEREIGTALGHSVDLSHPASLVVGFVAERFLLARELRVGLNQKEYARRHPKTRPFFRPGVLLPRIARAVVNLTRIREGGKLMDPFCGTGGVLIEAGLIGAEIYGCDIDPRMVRGCEVNLEHYGISMHHLEVGDAREMGERYPSFFDAIATDPPYGISASTGGLSLEKLYMEVFPSFYRMLKANGYACVLSPEKIPTEEYAANAGFTVVEVHLDRVHAGLTRKILVVKK